MKPFIPIWWRNNSLFIFAIEFFSQHFPWIIRLGNILNSMYLMHRVGRLKIKRAEVNGIQGIVISSMKSNTYKTFLKFIFSFSVENFNFVIFGQRNQVIFN